MTRTLTLILAGAGSAALLIGALGFQFIGEMAPCKMCYWQRYPHVIAVVIAALALKLSGRVLPVLGAISALTTAGIGAYHTGVERDWWEGPSTCTSGSVTNMSAEDLMAQIMDAPLVRCDEVPWELFTLSMASWNMLASLVFVAFWLMAIKRS